MNKAQNVKIFDNEGQSVGVCVISGLFFITVHLVLKYRQYNTER